MSTVAFVVADEGLGGIVPFGQGLARLGVEPVLLTGAAHERQLHTWRQVYSDVGVLDNPYRPAALVAAARDMAAGRTIAALFSCYDGLSIPAAVAGAVLGLPHPALEGLAGSRNKLATRTATRGRGLPTPRFAPIDSVDGCAGAASTVGFPAVLKPLNGMASHLVRRVDSLDQLERAYRYTRDRLQRNFAGNYREGLWADPASGLDPLRTLLLEEELDGEEYSAEVLVRDGHIHRIALFHKFLVREPGYLECGFTRPPLTPSDRSERIWRHIEDCIQCLGVANATAHVEVIDTADGPRLVEVNAGRAGGQILALAVRLATGVDLIAEILALALGRERPGTLPPEICGRITTFTIFPPQSGRLDALTGLDELEALPGVARVVPFAAVGDWLDADDKEVFAVNFLAQGGDEPELRALYAEACRLVRFQMSVAEFAGVGEGIV
jgi:biotin carboxylase